MNTDLQTVIDSVNERLTDTNLKTMTESVVNRLVSFGFTPTTEDVWLIIFQITSVANHITNQINQNVIPTGLTEKAIDMICGQVLNSKYLSGQLDLSGLDLDGAVQSVKEGDTSVTFGTEESDDAKLKKLLSFLMEEGDLSCYRKMRW